MDDLQLSIERLSDVWSGGTVERDLSALSSLSNSELPIKARVKTAESRLLVALESARAFGKSTISLGPVTLSEETDSIREMLRVLDMLATTYRDMSDQLTVGRSKLTKQLAKHLSWCMYRELACLYEMCFLSSAAFITWDKGLWQRAHRVFRIATDHGVHQLQESTGVTEHFQSQSIGDLYLTLVLAGLSDPYQLPFRDVYRVEKFLQQRRSYADIRRSTKDTNEKHTLFVLNPDVDSPGLPLWSLDDPDSVGDSFILNTTGLVRYVRKKRHDLSKHPSRGDKDFDDSSSVSELKLLYKQLGSRWSGRLDRRHERKPSSRSVDVLISLDAVLKALGASSAGNDIEQLFSEVESAYDGGGSDNMLKPSASDLVQGSSIDKSTSGIRMRIEKTARLKVRIGDVVAWNDSSTESKSWRIGTVRWIRESIPEHVDIGLMRIPGVPMLGSMSLRFGKRTTSFTSDLPCLLSISATRDGLRLNALVPRMHDAQTSPADVSIGGEPLMLVKSRRILSTRLVQGFSLIVDPRHDGRLARAMKSATKPKVPTRARRGQIWSAQSE